MVDKYIDICYTYYSEKKEVTNMTDLALYRAIENKLWEDRVAVTGEKRISIDDEKGQTLIVDAWFNSRGYIHFRTVNHNDNEQYRFTSDCQLEFEGWV